MYISKIFLKEIEKNYIGCANFSKIEIGNTLKPFIIKISSSL